MKNVFLALVLSISFSGVAQVFQVKSIEKINIPENPCAKVAAISEQGDFILLTSSSNRGLTKFDLATNHVNQLTDAMGAGYDVKISTDGQSVVYRTSTFTEKHLRKTALMAQDLVTGKTTQLVAPTRDLQGVAMQGSTATIVNRGKLTAKALSSAKTQATLPVLSIKNRELMITRNGKTTVFNPNGQQLSYLWPSVSPDGSKALYYVAGQGTYVCNIDGSDVKRIGSFRAPVWYDNNIVLGMNDQDDGEFIYASTIVAANLNGDQQTLTNGEIVAMYPHASATSGKIVFSTPAGEAYMINVNK